MARIVFFINTLNNSGGTERVSLKIAEQLMVHGHDVTFITWMGGQKSFFDVPKGINHVALFEADSINIYTSYLKSLYRYYNSLRRINPDYIVDVCVAMSILSIPLNFLFSKKVISWEHFNATVNWNGFTGRLSRFLASRFADRVVVLTDNDANYYQQKFRARNVQCIPNPVTLETERVSRLDNKVVLAVGRLTHQKGFDMLLEAWKLVTQQAEDWTLYLVGSGELEHDLKSMAKLLQVNKSVVFKSATSNIAELYEHASIFVMSSRFEGLPLVLLEAKTFGLPIVSFDCETGPRSIVNNEIDGLLVKPECTEDLAQAILRLIGSYPMRLTFQKNTLQAVKKYKMAAIIENWLPLLTK